MKAYLWFASKRAMQMILVIFVGISAAFLITHLSPINPVEQRPRPDHRPIEFQP